MLLEHCDPQVDHEYKTTLHFVVLLGFYIYLLHLINLMLFLYRKWEFSPSHICKLLNSIVWILLFVFSLTLNLELVGRKTVFSPLPCECFIWIQGRVCLDQWFLNWSVHQNHLETQRTGPPQRSWLSRSRLGWRISLSNRAPGCSDAVGSGPVLLRSRVKMEYSKSVSPSQEVKTAPGLHRTLSREHVRALSWTVGETCVPFQASKGFISPLRVLVLAFLFRFLLHLWQYSSFPLLIVLQIHWFLVTWVQCSVRKGLYVGIQ